MGPLPFHIQAEQPQHHAGVAAVHLAAFPTAAEKNLVDTLRIQARPLVSLVATDGAGSVLGHILFSPVTVEGHGGLHWMGLAPMAVLPAHQKHGVGSALVQHGLDACRALGVEAVVVLGHTHFYPRFGFVPASRHGLSSIYNAGDAFMVLPLQPDRVQPVSGLVRYHPALDAL